jgi:hypothetical protein
MPNDCHPYGSLDSALREIRLLMLQAGGHDEPLQCRLFTASLTSNAEYNALSYVWGNYASTTTVAPAIQLDGNSFLVTPNLYSALLHLRPPMGSDAMRLWVDAVCINQNDLIERNSQVAMMRDIYASAAQVTIWLGEEDEDSDIAFDSLPTVIGKVPWPEDKLCRSKIRRHCASFFFGLLDRRSWFSRVWILQELAMSRSDPIVVCGRKHALWSTFVAAWQAIAKEALADLGTRQKVPTTAGEASVKEDHVEILSLTKLDVLHELRQAVQVHGGDSLGKLLKISRTSAATDPRDRIYGLLGLLEEAALDPASSTPISVDYRKSCSDVYADAMAHIVSIGEGPYFLSGVCLSGGPCTAPQILSLPPEIAQLDFPSWVPDFSRQNFDQTTQPYGYHFHPPATMHASGAGQGAKNGTVLADRRTLQVEGLIVDTIVDVIPFGSSLEAVKENLVHFEVLKSEAKRRPCLFPLQIASLMLTFRDSEPLWRILISNKHQKSGYEPAPLSYESMYTSLLYHQTLPKEGQPADTSAFATETNQYEEILRSCVGKKSFCTTTNGFIGTSVPASRTGDIIAIVFGSPSPFVLRPIPAKRDEKQAYWLIGNSYVGGIMDGEVVDELYCEDMIDSTTLLIR